MIKRLYFCDMCEKEMTTDDMSTLDDIYIIGPPLIHVKGLNLCRECESKAERTLRDMFHVKRY